jgi:feruloyl-CoA synthase
VAIARCGESIRIMTGLGMTETSPSCTFGTGPISSAGYVGVPAPGCKVKLVPVNGKLEARFHGPHVTPGYWRAPQLTSEAFDADGYYCTGDALRFVDDAQPELGFMFDGRIAEDFKLSSGTFVSVGPLRARVISQGAPYVQDAVVTGWTGMRSACWSSRAWTTAWRCPACGPARPLQVLASAPVRASSHGCWHAERERERLLDRVERCCCWPSRRRSTHASRPTRVRSTRRRCCTRRAALVDAMYDGTDSSVIVAA